MKNRWYLVVSLLLMLSLIGGLAACSSNPPATTTAPPVTTSAPNTTTSAPPVSTSAPPVTAPAQSSTTPTQQAAKVYTLKAADSHAPKGAAAVAFDYLAKRVGEVTNGQVKIECYHSSSLVGANDTLAAVRDGLIDFGWASLSYTRGQMPFSEWADNVPYYVVDADQVKLFYAKALPAINDEFKKKGWPIQAFATTSGLCEWYFKKPVDANNPNWSGLKVRSAGEPWTSVITILGGSPVSASSSETALMASTGLIDASTGALSSYDGMGLYDSLPYVWISGWRNFAAPFMMNTKSISKLPADLQQKVMGVLPEVSDYAVQFEKDNDDAVIAKMKEKSKEVTIFTAAQRKALIDKVRPIYDSNITDLGSKGYPAADWMKWLESLNK